MPAFRILDQAPQYLLPDGRVNAGGSLTFYETDLTTLKDTWSNEALSVLNSNPVVMDAYGRTLTDVWGDGEYGVVMKNATGVVIWTRNNVRLGGEATQQIPALVAGQFLTNDGSVLQWQPILQVPDTEGTADQILYSDGELPYWGPAPEPPVIPEPDIVVGTNSFTAGVDSDNTKFFVLTGTATAPATGAKGTSTNITFTPTFGQLWWVGITTTIAAATPSGALVDNSVTGWTPGSASSGVTVNFNVSDDDDNSNWKISNPINFAWVAIGTREVS